MNNPDPAAAHTLLQSVYTQTFDSFMRSSPTCPYCSHRLYRHDARLHTVKCADLPVPVTLTIRRVRCPHCGRTHRVLPSFIIPRFQICDRTAAEILDLFNKRKSVLHHSNGLIDASTPYRFINRILRRFRHVVSQLKQFWDLSTISASQYNSYRRIIPDLFNFPIFLWIQPIP